jgi:hypothetical protein
MDSIEEGSFAHLGTQHILGLSFDGSQRKLAKAVGLRAGPAIH